MAESKSCKFLEWGCAMLALPGETQSGDMHLVQPHAGGALAAVVDGLGHGVEAAAAAKAAIDILSLHAGESVIPLVRRCHQGLRKTRGVVATLVSFNFEEETMTWLGVGNVDAKLFHRDLNASAPVALSETILLRGGVVGYHLPTLHATVISLIPGDVVILTTDGISSFSGRDLKLGAPPQMIADHVLARHAKGRDDALVLVVRYLGTRP